MPQLGRLWLRLSTRVLLGVQNFRTGSAEGTVWPGPSKTPGQGVGHNSVIGELSESHVTPQGRTLVTRIRTWAPLDFAPCASSLC